MEYTVNSDPTYYNQFNGKANCGSFALRLKEWYDPEVEFIDEVGDISDWIRDMIEESDYTEYELSEIYSDCLVKRILYDFEGEIEHCEGYPPETDDKELIAFSTYCLYDGEYGLSDFHFKVLRDGVWQEKQGTNTPQICDENDWGWYTSDIVYFYHKIGDLDDDNETD